MSQFDRTSKEFIHRKGLVVHVNGAAYRRLLSQIANDIFRRSTFLDLLFQISQCLSEEDGCYAGEVERIKPHSLVDGETL
jgi:hypothetical protein